MNIISFSGGKDSTAMLLRMVELRMPIDEIRYFDCGIWEFPQMFRHIEKVKRFIGFPIRYLTPAHSFDYLFSQKRTKKGFLGYGFPSLNYRWCTGRKRDALNRGCGRDSIKYIGYSIDELKRTQIALRRDKRCKFPLIEWGWSEKDCLNYCYEKGFDWEGLYKHFRRVSCWCCPFQGINELRNLRKYFPNLWKRLLEMQQERLLKRGPQQGYNNTFSFTFRMDGTTVFDLEERFKMEEKQLELDLK